VHRLAVVAGGRIVAEGEPGILRERYGTEATVAWTEPDGTPRAVRTGTPTRTVAGLTRRFGGEIPG
jgi:ABC-2 type transport system ATP-binding protein